MYSVSRIVGVVCVIGGVVSVGLNYSQVLVSLLRLELCCVGLFSIASSLTPLGLLESYFLIYYLLVIVCESVVGLRLLVAVIHVYGRDSIKSVSRLRC